VEERPFRREAASLAKNEDMVVEVFSRSGKAAAVITLPSW